MNHTETLTRIVRHLTLNYSGLPSPGLFDGKMGGVVFFYLYARYADKPYYGNIADNLFDDVSALINEDMSISFSSGLCGIGWGVEYLIQNKFIDADPDDILEDIDAKIMESNVCRISNWNFDTGLAGILYYVTTRLKSYDRQGRNLPFDTTYLQDLLKATENYSPDTGSVFSKALILDYQKIMNGEVDYNTAVTIPELMYTPVDNEAVTNLTTVPLGIKGGLTGMALKLMSL